MISRYAYHGLTWVDLESPSREEILHISEEFGLSKLVEEEMFADTLRSKIDVYDNFIYLVLHFPTTNKHNKPVHDQELDFIIGKNYILTVRYEPIAALNTFAALFENVEKLDQNKHITDAGVMVMEMMKMLYQGTADDLDGITNRIPEIEHNIFAHKEEKMARIISHTTRKLLAFKQPLSFHKDVLTSYETASKRLFGDSYGYHAARINTEYNQVCIIIETSKAALEDLRHAAATLLTAKNAKALSVLKKLSFSILILLVISTFCLLTMALK